MRQILAMAAIGVFVLTVTGGAQKTMIVIPPSVQAEHTALRSGLAEATKAPGRVGDAAKELAALVAPHFDRENEIALPPLGLLAPLAAGKAPANLQEALDMSDALRKELPRMLDEHRQIRAAAEKLRSLAREESAGTAARFAEALTAHARTEEEVLYPAALLVGDIIRARRAPR